MLDRNWLNRPSLAVDFALGPMLLNRLRLGLAHFCFRRSLLGHPLAHPPCYTRIAYNLSRNYLWAHDEDMLSWQ